MSRSTPVTIDGILFASKAEGRRYRELWILQEGGIIRNLKCHTRYLLQEGFTNWRGERIRPIYYTDDFSYIEVEDEHQVVEDVKSGASKTQVYEVRKKLFQYRYRDIEFREVEA